MTPRRRYAGPTVLSAMLGLNSDLFLQILKLYAKPGDHIFDATYGRGVFWKKVDRSQYRLATNDLDPKTRADMHEDFGALPWMDESLDMFVLDPPYIHSGTFRTVKKSIAQCYGTAHDSAGQSHDDGIALYKRGIAEAKRMLKRGGILVLKGMDEIESNKQRLFLQDFAAVPGFVIEDVFVLVQKTMPCIRWWTIVDGVRVPYQHHARKNHSYFLVLRKLAA